MKLEGQKKLEMCTEFQQLLLNLNVYFSCKFLNISFLVLLLINQRCNDIQRQTAFANIRVKSSLMFCYEIKLGRGREEYTVCWIRKERSGLSWLITSLCRLRGLRRGWERGSGKLPDGKCHSNISEIIPKNKKMEVSGYRMAPS
jgi:hypothetical protein